MSIDTSELLKLVKRYDDWNLSNKIAGLGSDQPDGYVGRLLWTARKAGGMKLKQPNYLLYLFPGAPDLWDAEDFLALVHEVDKECPNGTFSGGASGWCGDLPGSAQGFQEMIKEKQGDKAFSEIMRKRWMELPEYWRIGIGFYLVAFGHMPRTELSDDMRREIARAYLVSSSSDYEGELYLQAFPTEEWRKLCMETLLADPTFSPYSPKSLKLFTSIATPAQLFQITLQQRNTHGVDEAILALDALDKKAVELLEEAVLSLDIQPLSSYGYDEPWGYPILIFSYLRHCKKQERTPPASFDPILQALLENYKITWGGGNLSEYQKMMVETLRCIPASRLEPIFAQLSEFPWLWLSACGTPSMLKKAVDMISALPKRLDYQQERLVKQLEGERYYSDFPGGLLEPLLDDLIPHLLAALTQPKTPPPQNEFLFRLLARSQSPEVVEGLVWGVEKGSKATRDLAIEKLAQRGVDVCLPLLEKLLGASRKDVRLIAAQLMQSLPPDSRLSALAKACLEKEKSSEVADLLRPFVEQPAEDSALSTGHEDVIEKLRASDGACWKDHLDLGPALVEIYWRALIPKVQESELATYEDVYLVWLELLRHFQEAPIALEYAIKFISCLRNYYTGDYLEVLEEIFPTLHEALLPIVQADSLLRPAELGGGKHPHCDAKMLLYWMAFRDVKKYGHALLAGLNDRRSTSQNIAKKGLLLAGMESLPFLKEALSHDKAKVRQVAVELLGELASKEVLGLLEQALKTEKQAGVKSALEKAIAGLRSATLDFSAFASTAEGEAQLDAVLATLPLPSQPDDLDRLPDLRWAHGEILSQKAKAWVIATLRAESMKNESEALAATRRHLDDKSCYALADKMLEGYESNAHMRFSGNLLFVQGILGKPEHIEAIAGKLDDLASSRSTHWGEEGVDALVRNGSDAAIRFLEHSNKKSRRNALRGRAGGGLHRLAARRGMSVEELLDSAVSHFGFDADGVQILDYGARQITVRLGADNEMLIFDEKGKAAKSLPKARKDDDADKVAAIHKAITSAKKQIKQIHKSQLRRLEDALASGRTWSTTAWTQRFLQHPLMHGLSRQLVWEFVPAQQDVGTAFLVTEEGELINADLDPIELAADGVVRIQHPIHLEPAQREAWQEILTEQGITPPFSQLDRRIFKRDELPEDKVLFSELPLCNEMQYMGRVIPLGYERGSREDAGLIFEDYRKLGDFTITLRHNGYYPEASMDQKLEFTRVFASKDGQELGWRELPALILSEVVRDMHLLMGG